jgi:5-methylcytosine-specific restriction protein A
MGNGKTELQHILEMTFDIPFHVESGISNGDPWYMIRPSGYTNELFEIRLVFLNQLRLNIECLPYTYAAPLIKDMANASPDKRTTFMRYAKLLIERKAKIEFVINNIDVSVSDSSDWPQEWKNVKLKITKTPIVEKTGIFAPEKIIVDWGCLFVGMALSLIEVIPIDNSVHIEGESEGCLHRIIVSKYERSPVNRNLCLVAKGYSCKVCGMDFQSKYGKLGIGYIHVHHIIPVSKMGLNYVVDPINDLEPVCPNCHAMLHRQDPPLEIKELKEMIDKQYVEPIR